MKKNCDLEKRLGSKLYYLRKNKKLTQMKLAELSDNNFKYIGEIERGEANPTLKVIKNIADALDVEVKQLFDFSF